MTSVARKSKSATPAKVEPEVVAPVKKSGKAKAEPEVVAPVVETPTKKSGKAGKAKAEPEVVAPVVETPTKKSGKAEVVAPVVETPAKKSGKAGKAKAEPEVVAPVVETPAKKSGKAGKAEVVAPVVETPAKKVVETPVKKTGKAGKAIETKKEVVPEVAPKKRGRKAKVADGEEASTGMRTFKIICSAVDDGAPFGHITATKPKAAANKGFTSIARRLLKQRVTAAVEAATKDGKSADEIAAAKEAARNEQITGPLNFMMLECTSGRGSREEFYYTGTRAAIADPKVVMIKDGKGGEKAVTHNFKNTVMKNPTRKN